MFTKKLLFAGERCLLFLKILHVLSSGSVAQLSDEDSTSEDSSEETECSFGCSLVHDPVCGSYSSNGDLHIEIFPNLCRLLRAQCKLAHRSPNSVLTRIPEEDCGISKKVITTWSGRRETDFSIVGAHQACNHTCPTHCTDVYDPACANIHMPEGQASKSRVMLNHCHVDLLSCSLGLNVTLEGINNCYLNPSNLMFMTQVAGMKSLGLLDETGEFKKLLAEKTARRERRLKKRQQEQEARRRFRRSFKENSEKSEDLVLSLQKLIELTRTASLIPVQSAIEI